MILLRATEREREHFKNGDLRILHRTYNSQLVYKMQLEGINIPRLNMQKKIVHLELPDVLKIALENVISGHIVIFRCVGIVRLYIHNMKNGINRIYFNYRLAPPVKWFGDAQMEFGGSPYSIVTRDEYLAELSKGE